MVDYLDRVAKAENKVKPTDKLAFASLISFIKSHKVTNKRDFKKKLGDEIKRCETFLANERTFYTINRRRREFAKKLEYFKKIETMMNKYL